MDEPGIADEVKIAVDCGDPPQPPTRQQGQCVVEIRRHLWRDSKAERDTSVCVIPLHRKAFLLLRVKEADLLHFWPFEG